MVSGGALSYLRGDHLGSTSLTTDNLGNKISEIRYKPWGEVRSTWKSSDTNLIPSAYALTRQTFTGQYSYMDDPSTATTEGFGLMFYQSRFYDPYLNHFTQPDSIVPDPYNSQDWDRYSYVHNNPVKYTDPTGHCSQEGDDWCFHSSWNKPKDDKYPSKPIDIVKNILPSGQQACNFILHGSGSEDMFCSGKASKSLGELNLWPDYYTLQIGAGAPLLPIPSPFGGTVIVTYSNGHMFFAVGGNAGKTFTMTALTVGVIPVSLNGSAGWIIAPQGRATPQQALDFQKGTAVNIGFGGVVGAGVNINSSGMAFEAGGYTPQVGVTVSHTVLDIDLTTNDWDWWP